MAIGDVMRASKGSAAALAILGLFWGGFVPWLPDYKARLAVSDAVMGQILLFSAVGGMAAMAAAPRIGAWVGARLGGRMLLPFGALVTAASFLPLAGGTAWGFGAAMVTMGAAMSFLDILTNLRISEAESRSGKPLMNFNHGVFSLSFAVAAIAVGAMRSAGLTPEMGVPILACVMATLCGVLMRRDAVMVGVESDAADATKGSAIPRLLLVMSGGFILFAAFVSENAIETWATFHFERNLGAAPGEGAFGPAVFGLMMALGRFGGQGLSGRLGSVRLLRLSAILGAVGALILAVSPVAWLAVFGIALAGIGASVVVPTGSSLIADSAPKSARARALSWSWMFGFTGFFIGPVGMGMIAQTAGLRWGFAAVAVLMALVLPWLIVLRRAGAHRN